MIKKKKIKCTKKEIWKNMPSNDKCKVNLSFEKTQKKKYITSSIKLSIDLKILQKFPFI